MQLTCPSCGTRDVRVSHPQGLVQYLKNFLGISGLRCRRCSNRWETSAWADGSWRYARCPRCYRQDLTKWTMRYYTPPRWTRFLLWLGASPRRCPVCRCNFASFKPQKGNFAWQHQARPEPAPPTPGHPTGEPEAAMVAEHTPPGEGSREQMP